MNPNMYRVWMTGRNAVIETDSNDDLHRLAIIREHDWKLIAWIYPETVQQLEEMREALDYGADPIRENWKGLEFRRFMTGQPQNRPNSPRTAPEPPRA